MWSTLLDILPTSYNLFKRKVIQFPICQKCNRVQQDRFHALVGCKVVKKVWRLSIFANSVISFESTNFSCFAQSLADYMSKENFESFVVLPWSIWRDKNLMILHNDMGNDALRLIIRKSFIENYKLMQHSLAIVASMN